MTKKGLSITNLSHVRGQLREMVAPSGLALSENRNKIVAYVNALADAVMQYEQSPYLPYKVSRGIHEQIKAATDSSLPEDKRPKIVTMSMALESIHEAIWRVQEMMSRALLQWYAELEKTKVLSEALYDRVELNVRNHPVFDSIQISEAERKREAEYAVGELTTVMQEIKAHFTYGRSLFDWASKQLEGLNRLDAMIRLKQRIGEQLVFESFVSDSVPQFKID